MQRPVLTDSVTLSQFSLSFVIVKRVSEMLCVCYVLSDRGVCFLRLLVCCVILWRFAWGSLAHRAYIERRIQRMQLAVMAEGSMQHGLQLESKWGMLGLRCCRRILWSSAGMSLFCWFMLLFFN